jgi:predicted DNA-binding mobile mystery protein A
MTIKQLQAQQLDQKLNRLADLLTEPIPSKGWLRTIRMALSMPLEYPARKQAITRQAMLAIERREAEGTITLNALRKAANALEMKLVYAIIPLDGSLEALIQRRAYELALRMVERTSVNMALEDQGLGKAQLDEAIKRRTEELINEKSRKLWQ